ncbi:unnamed protein product [Arctia plantaginis]|uniref:DUF4746 domain-containing protein n=1 Tax=Arctia plantaginis TaxID=874455 RepID=A0A8S1AMW3_ARCPL|nr:unnamed protein product [Arctia plantaginis]
MVPPTSGQLINVVFGADAPRIVKTIEQELKNEELAKKGELERIKRAPHELTPPEQLPEVLHSPLFQEIATRQAKLEEERKIKEQAAVEAARFDRREARAQRLETHFADICPALLMPHAQKNLRKITDSIEPFGLILADKCPIVVGKEGARILAVEDPEMGTTAAAAAIAERPSLALLFKKVPDKEGDIIELTRQALCGDHLDENDEARKKLPSTELRADDVPGIFVPADRHQRAAALDLLFPKMVGSIIEPPPAPEPPHIAIMFGAWQRRAVLSIATQPNLVSRLMHYGFFADTNIEEPTLVCKNIDQYELRPDKDYCETIVLMIAVGLAEPLLADPEQLFPAEAPEDLVALGPLHISEDAVKGSEECARFFPLGYSVPERKAKLKNKKKKKRRNKEENTDSTERTLSQENAEEANEENGVEGEEGVEGDENGEGEDEEIGNGDDDSDEQLAVDKATSPLPSTPH